ncbi:MAG: hypothetical protein IT555_09665 [Acetobacteraceae bacterium]|nr:hypothetical protein [Acetobacteraceae bacterium]
MRKADVVVRDAITHGRSYNRLEVLDEAKPNCWRNGVYARWRCACNCGAETIVLLDYLKLGAVASCDCLHREVACDRPSAHGARVHTRTTPGYHLWRILRERFGDQVPRTWQHKWGQGFMAFVADVGLRPSPDHRLLRIDPNRKWSARNCHWVTSPKRIGVSRR